jgi:WD40 repeat protein
MERTPIRIGRVTRALWDRQLYRAGRLVAPLLCLLIIHLGQARAAATGPGPKGGPRVDRHGDPLPEGALVRLGTVRLRHPGYIDQMTFAPGGKVLATAGYGSVSLWDWASGKELPGLPATHVGTVAFSPSGRLLATASDREKVRIWDRETGKVVHALDVRRKASMVYRSALFFAEDGQVLVYAGDDGVAQAWEVKTGKERWFWKLPEKGDMISAVALAPNAKVLAYAARWTDGMDAGPVCLLDLTTGKELLCLRDHKQPVWSLAFSPDGTILASASTTEPPILWNAKTGERIRALEGENHGPKFLTFSPDGQVLACGDSWNKLRLWEVATGKQRQAFQSDLLGDSCLAFSPDSKTLAVADGNAVRLLDALSGKEVRPSGEPMLAIDSVGWLADSKTVALGTGDAVWLREATTGKALGKLWQLPTPRSSHAAFVAISPDGKSYGLAHGASVKLFDMSSRKLVHTFVGTNQKLEAFSFSADGKLVAAAVGYDMVSLWDCTTGKSRQHLEGKPGTNQVALAPDGKTAATAYASPTGETSGIELWDLASGQALRDLPINKAWIHTLAFSPDSRTLAATTISQSPEQGGLIVWELASAKQRFRLPEIDAVALAFSPNAKLLACEGPESTVCLIDAGTGKQRHLLRGHRARISGLAFSADGTMLVSGSWDATALVWDIASLTAQ